MSASLRRTWWLVLLTSGLCVAAGTRAAAQDEAATHVRLELDVASGVSGCPSPEELSDRVAARLGYVPFSPTEPRAIRVRIATSRGRLRVVLEDRDAAGTLQGRRELASADGCGAMQEALALALALLIDPGALSRAAATSADSVPVASPSASPSAAPTPSEPAVRSLPAQSPAPRETVGPPTESALRLSARVLVEGALGTGPRATVGGALGVGVSFGVAYVGLEAHVNAAAQGSGALGAYSVAPQAALLAACGVVRWARLCGVGQLGRLAAEGSGFAGARMDYAWFAHFGPRLEGSFVLAGPIAAIAGIDALATVQSARIELDDGHALWKTPLFFARLFLGIGATW